jgi:UDP:flavonoid glycosyltransferase YjiC (YdhE family)
MKDLFVGDLPLVLGIPETDPLPPGAKAEYIGAVLWQKPAAQLPQAIESLDPDRPIIWVYSGNPRYFSFHSPYDSEAVIQACIEALAVEPVQIVLTIGHHPLPAHLLPLPGNFLSFPFVPGLLMAQRSRIMIHHGGYGSCQTGFFTGTPAIILPTYSERESNARRVVQVGAGEMILPVGRRGKKEISAEALKMAVRRVLADPGYRTNAQRIARLMAAYGGAAQAAHLIETL